MTNVQSKLAFEALRTVAITAGYANLGPVTAHPIRMFKIHNGTDNSITISYDGGTTDHEFLPTGGFLLIDCTANRVAEAELVLAKGVQVSVKGAGAGNVTMSTYYAV